MHRLKSQPLHMVNRYETNHRQQINHSYSSVRLGIRVISKI